MVNDSIDCAADVFSAFKGYKEKIVDIREEILRKRRAGKLPGDTTSLLKAWWQSHAKWPYPTVSRTNSCMAISLFNSICTLNSYLVLNVVAGGRQGKIGAGNGLAIKANK